LRTGALESLITPSYGLSRSRIRTIAADTDSAQANMIAMTRALRGANRLKEVKMMVNHPTSTIRNGVGIVVLRRSRFSTRARAISLRMLRARD
jgi:hypothetical protein